MASLRSSLTRQLTTAGLSRAAVDGLWPEWWSDEAEQSMSAAAELRFTIARRLGIAPSTLFGHEPRFVWRHEAKFKNLGDASEQDQAILTSFGISVARALIAGTPRGPSRAFSAEALRSAVLEIQDYVNLPAVLKTCWDLGIPVIKTNLLPLRHKRMQAMSVRLSDRFAILVARNTRQPAWIAFIIAHEMGHIFNQHLADQFALLEMDDPLLASEPDDEEREADRFALRYLTGNPEFSVTADTEHYNAAQVAEAVSRISPVLRVDPGIVTLSLAHSSGNWGRSNAALKLLPNQLLDGDVGDAVNWYAAERLDWASLSDERASYIRAVIGPVRDG